VTAAPASPAAAAASERAVECAHCALPVPAGRVREGDPDQFCCGGCEVAYNAIRACGLDEYYALRRAMEREHEPARSEGRGYEELDDASFQARHCRAEPGGLMAAELYLEGVHCAACVWLLERLPRVAPGVASLELDLGRSVASVRWNPSETTLSAVARALDRFGYAPHPVEPTATRAARRRVERGALVHIGVAGACAGNVMLIAFALYSGIVNPIGEPYLSLFRWLSAGIGLLAVAWPGRVFFRGALAALRARAWHLDVPIALALGAGSAVGLANVARGAGEIYFDSLATLVFLLLVGRWLQTRQQKSARDSIELLFSVTPRRARLVDEDRVREIATDALEPGDVVEVLAGESVPVDGEIVSASATLDESVITGESRPVVRAAGALALAGTVNAGAALRVCATAVGRETRVGQMMALIERLSRSRTPIIGSADRIAGPFVVGVLALAALTLAIHLGSGVATAVDHAIALLIVCCPCAVALATPMATSAAIGRLARRGVLVKGGDVFEALARTPAAAIDKTGTVTDGRFTVRRWAGDETVRPALAALEARVAHPLAAALAAGAPEAEVDGFEHHPGLGVAGTVAGERLAAGSERFMRAIGASVPPWAAGAARDARDAGLTAVFVAREGETAAVAALGDAVRDDAAAALGELASMGWRVELLSGDHEATVRSVADRLGVELAEGGADPERKRERAAELRAAGDAVMVGDGVNDAAALAEATVGIAVSGGAEASLAAADVYLREPGLGSLVDLARTARRTVRIIRRCLAVAIAYNLAAGALAVGGMITPLAAAVVMPISSITVVSMALRAGSKR